MSQRFEGQFRGRDQTELFFQTWTPAKVRGVFIMTHGLAEHSDCYHPLAKILVEDGWQVYGWDLRGHGRSEGKRGYVKNFSDFVDDLEVFHNMVAKKSAGQNIVMFGHSLGGLITTRYLQSKKSNYAALCLSSPGFGLSVKVPVVKEKLARIAINWFPTITMHNEIKYEDLSHLEEMQKNYRADNLRHDKISPGLFLGMVENFPLALENAGEITQPVLMQLAGDDKLVSVEASRELFERLPNKKSQLLLYPESYHEIINDLDRDKVFADLKKFVNAFLGA